MASPRYHNILLTEDLSLSRLSAGESFYRRVSKSAVVILLGGVISLFCIQKGRQFYDEIV